MNKATRETRRHSGPSVYRFKARLARHPEAAGTGSWTLLVPKMVSKKLRGMTKVEGTMNGHPFRAALEPDTSGGRWLRMIKAVRGGAAAARDTVNVAILGPEPAPTVPPDLRVAFAASHKAKTLWKDLSTVGRRDFIRWIDGAKTPETRARRVRRTVEQLAEGKRRPCCVNVYEYMLARVQD